MTPESKPNMLDLFKQMLDDHLGKEEFTTAFKRVVESITELRQQNEEEFRSINQVVELLSEKVQRDTNSNVERLRGEVDTAISDQFAAIQQKLDSVRDGIDGKTPDEKKIAEDVLAMIKLPEQREIILDDADDIRNKLELLEGEDRLKIEAIRNLREELDELRGMTKQKRVLMGGNTGGGIVKAYDLSASLNGSLTTFAMPAFWRIISVHLSSFPNILRPTVDYTWDATAMTITFTSEIDAATSLSAGQSAIIVYAEN